MRRADGAIAQKMVPLEGLEPPLPFGKQILSLPRLPVPPQRQCRRINVCVDPAGQGAP